MRFGVRSGAGMAIALLLVLGTIAQAQEFDQYGGWKGLPIGNDSGYFQVKKVNGRYWFVTPAGNAMWDMGMDWATGWAWPAGQDYSACTNDGLYYSPVLGYNAVSLGNKAKYNNTPTGWMDSIKSRLNSWGFNTMAAASYHVPNMTQCVEILDTQYTAGDAGCRTIVAIGWHKFVDVFDPRYKSTCDSIVASRVKPQANDPYLVGWYIDNELIWNLSNTESLSDGFIKLPKEAPGKQHWANVFLEGKYGTLQALNDAYGTSFTSWTGEEATSVVSCPSLPDSSDHPAIYQDKLEFMTEIVEQYYKTATTAVRNNDPNHLIFSERLIMGGAHTEVTNSDGTPTYNRPFMERAWEVAGKYCDVMAVNCYWEIKMYEDTHQVWSRMYAKSGKPIIFTEWSPKANDTIGYNASWLPTQMDRAKAYQKYMTQMLDMRANPADPNSDRICVGQQWFCYYDYSPLRGDDDYHIQSGLLNGKDEAYLPLTDVMTSVNKQVYSYAAQGQILAVPDAPSAVKPLADAAVSLPVFEWTGIPGAASYTLLLSPEACFPEDQTIRTDGINVTSYTPSAPISPGIWYWTVKAVDPQGHGGQYLKTVKFSIDKQIKSDVNIEENLKCEKLDAWSVTDNTITGGDGTAYIFSDTGTKAEGGASARLVFTVNSYNKTTKAKNTGTRDIPLRWCGPALDCSNVASIKIDVYPRRFCDTSGAIMPSSKYVRVRFIDAAGSVVGDQPLDPTGALPVERWSSVTVPSPGKIIDRIEFYVKSSDAKLTWDARITLNVDNVTVLPAARITCAFIKRLPDIANVELNNKTVSAVFRNDGVIYVQEPDRSSGLRVVTSQSNLDVGDVVHVSGSLRARMMSGYPAEREMWNVSVSPVSTGQPPRPLGLTCRDVGGAAVPPYIPGVTDVNKYPGTGTNNMGQLVRIAGKITAVASYYAWVDDGSAILDTNGRTGAMVRLVSTAGYAVGDMISVTGIVEGNIPSPWTANRRYIHTRDAGDTIKISRS